MAANNSVDIQQMEVPDLQREVVRDLMQRSARMSAEHIQQMQPTSVDENGDQVVSRVITLQGTRLDDQGNIRAYRGPKSYDFNNILKHTQLYLADLQRDTFVERRACQVGLQILRKKNIVIVLGNSGDGRSLLGEWLLKAISEEVDCEAVMISSPKAFKKVTEFDHKNGEKLAVMIDDIFGSPNVMDLYQQEWRENMDVMWKFAEDKHVYFILTSKKHLYYQGLARIPRDMFKVAFILDITEQDLALTFQEKRDICRKHLREKGLDESIAVNLPKDCPTIGFCSTVKRFCRSKHFQKWGSRFFTNPVLLYSQVLEVLSNLDRMSWAVVVLILLGDGLFRPKKDKLPDKAELGQYVSFNDGFTPSKLRETCEQMKNVFIKYDENSNGYKFVDCSMEDAALLALGKEHQEHISERASTDFFVEYVVTDCHRSEKPDDAILLVFAPYLFAVLSARISREFSEGNVEKILCHRAFLDETWVASFVAELAGSDGLVKLLEVTDRHCGKGVLTLATSYGVVLLLRKIAESGVFAKVAKKRWAKKDWKEALEVAKQFKLTELANLLNTLC